MLNLISLLCGLLAQLEQSGARPVDEEANAEVLGFNKHQTFMALGRRLKQEEEHALATELATY